MQAPRKDYSASRASIETFGMCRRFEKKKEKKVELRVKVISLNEVLSITSVGS